MLYAAANKASITTGYYITQKYHTVPVLLGMSVILSTEYFKFSGKTIAKLHT